MTETTTLPALTESADPQVVASTIERLREAGVLGDCYADFATVLPLQDDEADFDRYESIGRFLSASLDATRWWIADWLIFGEGAFGERFYQATEATGLSETTLSDYARVAGRVARSRRRRELHFSHHREVAKLSPEDQSFWLDLSVNEGLSVRELRERMEKNAADARPELPGGGGHPDVDLVRVDKALLVAIFNEATEDADPRFKKVPNELIVRLGAAIGEGD